jgi:hypothetical protein
MVPSTSEAPSTSPLPLWLGSKTQRSSAPLAAAGDTSITFSEYPVGTTITNQYESKGVLFGADTPGDPQFITLDDSNPTSPVLSGSPLFAGAIGGTFVTPNTTSPTTVDSFSLDVGYIDDPGSTVVNAYASDGTLLSSVYATQIGINHLTISAPGITRFIVQEVGFEGNGFAIDNLSFTADEFTFHASLPMPNGTDGSGDQAVGSPALAAKCKSIFGQITYHEAELDGHTTAPLGMSLAPTGRQLLSHFLDGNGTAVDFSNSSSVASEIKASSAFKALDAKVQNYAASLARGGQHSFTVNSASYRVILGDHMWDNLYLSFRGTQGLDVAGSFHQAAGRFKGTVSYVIRDAYGFGLNDNFFGVGAEMHFLQSECGAPDYPGGAHWFRDSVTVTVPFDQPL